MHSRDLRLRASESALKGKERDLKATGPGLNEREPALNAMKFAMSGGDVGVSLFRGGFLGLDGTISDRRKDGKEIRGASERPECREAYSLP